MLKQCLRKEVVKMGNKYFFSHDVDARHDPKISALIYDYNMEG